MNYYWRLLATGFCFAVFGIGGLALSAMVFPVLWLIPAATRAMRARYAIHLSFRLFMGMMQAVGIMRLEVIGVDRLRQCRNSLVLSNHPTLIDVVALISLMPTASCVVKQALWRNPFLGGVVRMAQYISNADPANLIQDCADDLAAGNPLIIFPEGTRSQPGKLLHFSRGAAYIALKSGLPVLPVLITCTPSTLTKQHKWHYIPPRRFVLRLRVLESVQVSHWVDATLTPTLAARKLTRLLQTHFTHALADHANSQT